MEICNLARLRARHQLLGVKVLISDLNAARTRIEDSDIIACFSPPPIELKLSGYMPHDLLRNSLNFDELMGTIFDRKRSFFPFFYSSGL